jgi:hypothetical protein
MSEVIFTKGAAPVTPPAGKVTLYTKADGRFYFKDESGTEIPMKTTGAGSGDLLSDGTVPLTANWDVGAFKITALQFESDIVTGTAPFIVASTTVVANLNADQLDGNEATAFATSAQGGLADSALQPGDIGSTVQGWSAVLDATTASFLTADETKLDEIQALADVTDETNVKAALDGATITGATVATGDKVLIQDIDDSDNLKTVTAQSIADLVSVAAVWNIQSGTTYTIVEADNGKNLGFTNAAAIAVTLPDTLSTNFQCGIWQLGAGVPTVTPNTDTINGAGSGVTPDARWKGMFLSQFQATEWLAAF